MNLSKTLIFTNLKLQLQDEYLINAGKGSHLFEQLIVSKKDDAIANADSGHWPVCDAWNKFDIDHGPLLANQSAHFGQIMGY